ncbi:hypothetical protein BOH78_2579 [Pichia kudriavzevii]|uniref:Uncharacterized protein n=1 Tax=Pichia kudriavzevii TaxID=4909 RepID=A0A1V2LM65_PICKU|nr:hypothetical protein BOH78_5066 [Pichia kudriavzevii]ONH74090.1 hypothetical protein BOH78_2579 [Pichia kudriavzevii]
MVELCLTTTFKRNLLFT